MGDLKTAPDPRAIHLCIDMQRLFAPDGPWPTPWMERVLPTIVRLIEVAPARTLFTRFLTPARAEDAHGMWRAYYRKWRAVTLEEMNPAMLELVPACARFAPPAKLFDRTVYSCFADGRLHPQLRADGVDTLIVTGSETDVCVLSTVLSAVDLGYRVIVVKDGLCSSSDDGHDALVQLYARRFNIQIELATFEEVLDLWRPVA